MNILTENTVLARTRAQDLASVRKLNCWGCELANVEIIRKLPNVEVLSLSVNSISTLKDFANCKQLQELYIRKNDIRDLREVLHLRDLPLLRSLWLADNPCAEVANYRMVVLRLLPHLHKLDNIVVRQEEVELAQGQGDLELEPTPQMEPAPPSPLEETGLYLEQLNIPSPPQTESPPPPPSPEPKAESSPEPTSAASLNDSYKMDAPPSSASSRPYGVRVKGGKNRNSNILSAVLCLIKELDYPSLEVIETAVHCRMEELDD